MTGRRKSLSVSEQPNDVGHTADKWLPRDRTDFFRSLLALCSTHSPTQTPCKPYATTRCLDNHLTALRHTQCLNFHLCALVGELLSSSWLQIESTMPQEEWLE
nr:hypothetical protein HmN_000906900 [Hymenolepis microstoma]CUU97757.1 hypothetical transcript [Hymenolepis microstoma]